MSKKQKRLITSDQAKPRKTQHKKPCSDCPFARTALSGWLGGLTTNQWLSKAHGSNPVECHTVGNQQCAGLAIYRSNVCKRVEGDVLSLPADREIVFANPMEFTKHHGGTLTTIIPDSF